jgi:hypothetical protein
MLPARRFAFSTVGFSEDEGAYIRGAVARSSRGGFPSSRFESACMTCGASPPYHRVGTPVRTGGDFARDASRREWGNPPLKRGPSPG